MGSTPVRFADGQVRPVTQQLRTFKTFELLLLAVSPRAHRAIRAIYDRVGPALAARMTSRRAATLAWLALRPLELCARLVLRLVLRDAEPLIARAYPGAPLEDE